MTTYRITASGMQFDVERDEDGKFILPNEVRELQSSGTALKPAWEPICLARKPLTGTVAENVLEHGTGAINIDVCRVGDEERYNPAAGNQREGVAQNANILSGTDPNAEGRTAIGRWPANIVHDGSDEVVAAFPDSKSSGPSGYNWDDSNNDNPTHVTRNIKSGVHFSDSGSAARFFYTAKADKLDRIGSKHPTVKPVDLMQWLCRLVTPPGGLVLDPFAGSGSTGEAAWREGFRAILIEREEEYQVDIAERLRLASAGPMERKARAIKQADNDNLPLFGGAEATGGYAVKDGKSMDTSRTRMDGGIMAGKGGFGFRIREQRERANA